jgi:hypothetical protein
MDSPFPTAQQVEEERRLQGYDNASEVSRQEAHGVSGLSLVTGVVSLSSPSARTRTAREETGGTGRRRATTGRGRRPTPGSPQGNPGGPRGRGDQRGAASRQAGRPPATTRPTTGPAPTSRRGRGRDRRRARGTELPKRRNPAHANKSRSGRVPSGWGGWAGF